MSLDDSVTDYIVREINGRLMNDLVLSNTLSVARSECACVRAAQCQVRSKFRVWKKVPWRVTVTVSISYV